MARIRPDGGVIGTVNNPSTSTAVGMWSLKDAERAKRAGLWPADTIPVVADTYFKYTTLLLHGDGSNNANNTVFVDSSTNAYTVTTSGKPYQGTFSPFSQTGWSNYFNGSTSYFSFPNSSAFAFGTGAFTIEFWINAPSNNDKFILSGRNAIGTMHITTGGSASTIGALRYVGSSTITSNLTLITDNAWHHCAIVRDGSSNITLFIDGVSVGTGTDTTNYTTTAGTWYLGSNDVGAPANLLTGNISNLRIIKGTAQYTGSFTPPTSPLTAITNTQLLTCLENRFKDNSTNSIVLTPSGSPSVQPFSPFAPGSTYTSAAIGGSSYFNGSSDYLTLPNNMTAIGSSAYTLEGWFYPTTVSAAEIPLVKLYNATQTIELRIVSSKIQGRINNSATIVGGNTTLYPNQWYHFALVKPTSGTSTAVLYLNGVAESTTASDNTTYTAFTTPRIGANQTPNLYFTGWASGVRVLNGTAQYTANFTPPTTPFTNISNTLALVNFTNAGIIDHTAKNVITTAAGANISTTQSKYGGSSISLSGTSTGYLQLLSSNFNTIPASTDFTLECWLYTTASSTAPNVWHNTSSQRIIAFYLSDSGFNNLDTIMGPFSYPGSNASVVRGTTDVVANTWTHVAFVRSGSTITIYVNGTASGTGTSSYASLPLQLIGAISTGATTPDFYFFPGYIDDLRLTIGVARYTSNFTPKTTAFEDQ